MKISFRRMSTPKGTWRSVSWEHTVPIIIFPYQHHCQILCKISDDIFDKSKAIVSPTDSRTRSLSMFMWYMLLFIFKVRHSLVTSDATLSTQYSMSSSVFFTKCNDCANSLLNTMTFTKTGESTHFRRGIHSVFCTVFCCTCTNHHCLYTVQKA